MATRTKPLISAAALATAAAIAVASPAIAPNLTPTPAVLSAAQVELTTLSDLLSIPASEWSNVVFVGWGNAIAPINVDDQNYADYWLPNCNYNCSVPGISGVAYLALDALINGNGAGIDNVGGILQNPDLPYNAVTNPYVVEPWRTSAVNYYYEGGLAPFLQYITEYPFLGAPYRDPGPLYNPALSSLITLAWQGPLALSTLYIAALSNIAVLAKNVPLIGEYLYRGIGSYIGPAFATEDSFYDYGSSYAGISGVLRYVLGVIETGGNPNPYPLASVQSAAAAASSLAEAKPASIEAGATRASVEAPKAGDIKAAETASTDSTAVEATSTEAGSNTQPEPTATPDPTAKPDVTAQPDPTAKPDATATTGATTKPDTTPADTTPSVDSPSSAVANSTADSTPAATKPADAPAKASRQQRPVRSAVERATKKIASAIGGAAAKAAPAASGSADTAASAG